MSRDATCRICGKPEAGSNYCGYCGVEQSESALAFHDTFREYDHAARTVVRRARADRRVYGSLLADHSGRLPPLTGMVDAMIDEAVEPDGAVMSGHGPFHRPLLERLAYDRLERD